MAWRVEEKERQREVRNELAGFLFLGVVKFEDLRMWRFEDVKI